jgi:hypothetical protein
MNHFIRTLGLIVMLPLVVPDQSVSFAAEAPRKPADSSADARPKTTLVKFRPPASSARASTNSVRVTGGSRGTGEDAVTLDVLAPDQVGETTQEQPSLFWFQSRPAMAKFELTVLEEKNVKPLVQFTVERAVNAGIQRLKLSDHGAKLVPGVEYQWVVALITDPENRSTDLVASGAIKRVVPGPELKKKLAMANHDALPGTYADAGVWYDALAALSDQIEANPRDKDLRQARADLLRQIGLIKAAQFETADLASLKTETK